MIVQPRSNLLAFINPQGVVLVMPGSCFGPGVLAPCIELFGQLLEPCRWSRWSCFPDGWSFLQSTMLLKKKGRKIDWEPLGLCAVLGWSAQKRVIVGRLHTFQGCGNMNRAYAAYTSKGSHFPQFIPNSWQGPHRSIAPSIDAIQPLVLRWDIKSPGHRASFAEFFFVGKIWRNPKRFGDLRIWNTVDKDGQTLASDFLGLTQNGLTMYYSRWSTLSTCHFHDSQHPTNPKVLRANAGAPACFILIFLGFLYMFPLNHHKSTQWKKHPAYLTRISLNMCLIYFPSHPDLSLGCLFLLIIHLTTNYINPWITSRNSQQDRIVFPGWYRWDIASSFLTFLSFSGLLYYIKNHFSTNQPTNQPTRPGVLSCIWIVHCRCVWGFFVSPNKKSTATLRLTCDMMAGWQSRVIYGQSNTKYIHIYIPSGYLT